MKILIVGSEGFIGSYLAKHFSSIANTVVVGCDLYETQHGRGYAYIKVSRLSPQWDEVFTKTEFDACINAAGSGNVPYSMEHPLIDFEANTLDVIRLLEAIRRYNRNCKYLHISSAAVYGNPDHLPINEMGTKRPLSAYGWHKWMSEQICDEYHGLYGIPTAVIRPFSVYGEGLRKQLLWDICSKLRAQNTVQLFGSGKESRDFIHCQDLVRLIALLIAVAPFTGEAYNAASGEETTISKIANLFERYYQGKKKIGFSGEQRIGDPQNWRADISRINSLGFKTTINLEEGIPRFINWFEQFEF